MVLIKLLKYLKNFWKETIITWILVLLESVCEILVAYFLQFLLGAVQNGDLKGVILWACIIAIMAIVAAVTGVFAGILAADASTGFGRNLRETLYKNLQTFSFNDIDKYSTSSIITRSTTDISNCQFSFMMICRMVIRAPFMMVFALIMAFITTPKVSWIFLIIIPFLLTLLIFIATIAHKYFVKIFDTYDELNASVEENVEGIRVIKSFSRKDYHKDKFSKVSKVILDNYIKAEQILSFNNTSVHFTVYSAQIIVSIVSAGLIINYGNDPSVFTIAQLATLFTYIQMITMSLMMISQVYVSLIISRNSSERVYEIINHKTDLSSPSNGVSIVKNGDVDFKNVTFAYHDQNPCLRNLNLHFDSGKSYGIIGPTGSSKTTLISLIARLYDTTEGEVDVAGINVKDYDLKSLRDSVAVVLQKNTLFTGTIKDNLKWGNKDATEDQIKEACDIAQATEFISKFRDGLDTHIDQGGNNVSGGQKQRLCIARALLKNPKILILDDSTSACDTHTDFLIRERLKSTMPNVTKFIIAQRVLSIKDCDSILVMDERGNIVDQGNHDVLYKECDVYKELYDSQQGGGDFDATD